MASLWRKKSTGIWYVTYREKNNQRVRSLRTKDKREAARLRRTIETVVDEHGTVVLNATEPIKKNPTLEKFWPKFHSWAVVNRSATTVDEYSVWFNRFKEFACVKHLGDVTPEIIESFKLSLATQGKNTPEGVGLKPVSINNALKTLQSIWNLANTLGEFSGRNPFVAVERHKIPRTLDKDYLDKEQVDALLKTAENRANHKFVKSVEARNVYLAIALMALAGLRKREACFARWDWIDWTERIMIVTNDDVFTTKNKRPRIISMSAELLKMLEPYKKQDGYILEVVRATTNKTHYRVDFDRGFHAVCKHAGIQATPHDLRHSFASRHAVAGTSLHVIAGWLGHSTTWITQRYAHFQKTFNAAADNI
ncbi:MAG TPA: site-specific integrase [Candidatus Hydrogenedentes bacterium]|nr:site-specific integrase [Candidatus Hydrogenedentota bacterium]HRK34809.1 site-specific integrase [Candidatus Hydrogenedentota bacterium]